MQCFDPAITREIDIDGTTYLANDKYYLKEFSDWNPRIRDWLAEREDIVLGPEQLHVIEFLRATFAGNRRHPVLRMVTTELAQQFGTEKGSVKFFHTLFPGGIHQAFLLAGLPMQDSCC